MKKKNIIIGAVVIAAMSIASIANAATTTATSAAKIFTTQHAVAGDKLGVATGAAVVFSVPVAALEAGLNAGDKVVFTLSGGAKFNAASWGPAVVAGNFVVDAVPTAGGGDMTCLVSATGTVLNCTVGVVATAVASTITVTVPTTALYDLDLATANVTLDMKVTRVVGGVVTTMHSLAAGTQPAIFTVTNALQVATAVTKGADQVANVAGLFKTFVANGAATNKDTNNTTGVVSTTGSNTTVGQGQATGNFLVTLTGLPTAATKVTLAGGGIASSDAAAVAKTATNGGTFWLDGAGKGYAFLVGTGTLPTLANLFITMDGTTSITAGTVNLKVDYVVGTADKFVAHNVLAATPVAVITRNGASFTSDNISPSSVIRITDNGATTTLASLISISAWDAAGAPVTQIGATLPTSLLGGHTVTIAKGVLKAAFPTAVRFNINIESANASVTHFKSNAAGLNVTVGTSGTAKQL